jgi:hypothetical protein
VSVVESWEDRQKGIEADFAEMERVILRLEARKARQFGIDTTEPGWRDEYVRCAREAAVRDDSLIATPHVDEAIAGMEGQFVRD